MWFWRRPASRAEFPKSRATTLMVRRVFSWQLNSAASQVAGVSKSAPNSSRNTFLEEFTKFLRHCSRFYRSIHQIFYGQVMASLGNWTISWVNALTKMPMAGSPLLNASEPKRPAILGSSGCWL